MRLVFLSFLILLAAQTVAAEPELIVIDLITDYQYLYDDDGEEVDKLKSKTIKKQFADIVVGEESHSGLEVVGYSKGAGLVKVELKPYTNGVWLELMSIKLWPENRLECPEPVRGKDQIEQSGMTIGFGQHCKKEK